MIAPYAVGVDVGGTFTDCVLYNNETAEIRITKIPSTSTDASIAVFTGIDRLLDEGDISMNQVSRVIHGTTLVANAVIERKGARVGMITTRGFVNVLDMRREWRYDNYDFHLKFPEPLIQKHLRREVDERVWFDGSVLTPISEEEVLNAVAALVSDGVESLAICFLHSYTNLEHERFAMDVVKREFPDLYVTSSSIVAPNLREFERFSTTTINAYTLPIMDRYLDRLEGGLKERRFGGELFLFFVTSCSGGLVRPESARKLPVMLLESGPVAGVRIACHVGKRMGYRNVLSFDMGGTTAKGCLIEDNQAEKVYEFEVARIHRFKAGSGYPVTIPSIHLMEMGAGGGSIAKVDARGVLGVGPESVGSEPGPACYRLGGEQATVTDADLLLGYLNPEYFLGGRMKLDSKRAENAIKKAVAEPLNFPLEKASYGIFEVVSHNMSSAFRLHAAEKGVDIRKFDLFAFGGAGPVHAWRVAANLHCTRIVVPFEAGMASAMGLLVTPLAFDYARTKRTILENLTPDSLRDIYDPIVNERVNLLDAAGIPEDKIEIIKTIDMRYRGQGFNIEVKLPEDFDNDPLNLEELFEQEYRQLYSLTVEGVPVEAYNFKALVSGPEFEVKLDRRPEVKPGDTVKGSREAYFGEEFGRADCIIYDRYHLQPGVSIEGPSIVEEITSTCIIPPEASARIDELYNLVITLR